MYRVRSFLSSFGTDQNILGFSLGGMCGAIVTSPFDVVKTRLQSSLFQEKHATFSIAGNGVVTGPPRTNLLYNFVETGHILRYALFAADFTV